MPHASWLNVSPASGSGNATVNVSSGSPHTGRTARATNLTFVAAGCSDQVVAINQAGKPEFVTMQSTATAAKAGATVTITGTSNTNKLNFTLGSGDMVIALPATYTANSVSTSNNVAIAGDPGAVAEYNFSIAITVPENTSTSELTKQIVVANNAGDSAVCTITQAAGSPTLTVTPSTIELTHDGTAKTITVKSNTNWTAE